MNAQLKLHLLFLSFSHLYKCTVHFLAFVHFMSTKGRGLFPLIFNAAQLCYSITQASTKLFSVFRVLSASELRKEIKKRERVIDEHFGFGEAWWPTFWDSPLGLMRKQHPLAAHPVNSYCFSLPVAQKLKTNANETKTRSSFSFGSQHEIKTETYYNTHPWCYYYWFISPNKITDALKMFH